MPLPRETSRSLGVLAAVAVLVAAAVVVIQRLGETMPTRAITPSADAYVSTAHATENYGRAKQFVVGTGGANHTKFEAALPTSEVRDDRTFGVLQMTLRPTGYEWEFVPEEGSSFTDRGSDRCHEAPA